MNTPTDRRQFLGTFAAAVVAGACGTEQIDATGPSGQSGSGAGDNTGGSPGNGGAGGIPGQGGNGQGGEEPMVCTPSEDNIPGPYYRANAPFRTDLTDAGTAGTELAVSGRVLDQSCQPIAGALLDVWQCDDAGDYDNDGNNDPPGHDFILRGRMNADADGNYSFITIIPGRYPNGGTFRPSHIHIRVSAPGFTMLTTQLYFEGDPYNATDPWFLPELMLTPVDVGGQLQAPFDFVLEPA